MIARDDLLGRFSGVTSVSGPGEWLAHCPAHDDDARSLTIAALPERWSLLCSAGCRFVDVLGAAGIAWSDAYRPTGRPATSTTAALLDSIAEFVARFVVLPSAEARDFLAPWVAHTHAVDAAFATPYVRVVSATPSSGKSLLLEVLEAVTARGWYAVHPSLAVL